MGELTTLFTLGFASFVAIIAAFFGGKVIAKNKAESDSKVDKANEITKSTTIAANAEVSAANNANEVRDEIIKLNPGDASSQLRNEFSRD